MGNRQIEKRKRSRWVTSVAFGRWLRAERRNRGLSQEELAVLAGCDRTYPSLLERGKRNPTFDVQVNLCTALRTSIVTAAPKIMTFVRQVERETAAAIRASLPNRGSPKITSAKNYVAPARYNPQSVRVATERFQATWARKNAERAAAAQRVN